MGKVAPFQRLRTDRQYSEEELKVLAFEKYCSVSDGRAERIATYVGRSREEIDRWAEDGNWAIRRAEAKKKEREGDLAEIAKLLSDAGLMDRRQSAVEVLALCQRALDLAKQGLKEHGKSGVDPATLEKFVHSIERVQKVKNAAFSAIYGTVSK